MSESEKKAWYLVYCKPRQEKVAQENLARQSFETYLPMVCVEKRRNRQIVSQIEPMFPRYLFIQLTPGVQNFAPIRSTLGVSKLVEFGLKPAQVPDALVESLKNKAAPDSYMEIKMPEPKVGDKVRVVDGVMYGYEGILTAKSSRERVELLLEMVGTCARVKVPLVDIELAPTA
jgi:transcriptional antiterminator RfaH